MSNNNTPSSADECPKCHGSGANPDFPLANCSCWPFGAPDAANAGEPDPIDMLLYCPACGLQHVDAPDERTPGWKNEPHRSHLCHGCGCIWRPADVPTNGVAAIKTKGKADTPMRGFATPTGVAADTLLGSHLNYTRDHLPGAADESTRAPEWPAGLLDRVKAAEQRIADNHAPRRIPADVNDVDLVLAEVRRFLEGKAPPFWLDKLPSGERPSAPAPEGRPLSIAEVRTAGVRAMEDAVIASLPPELRR